MAALLFAFSTKTAQRNFTLFTNLPYQRNKELTGKSCFCYDSTKVIG